MSSDELAWPPLLTMRRAIAYTGKSRSTLTRAIQRGDLTLAGRCGGPRGERTFRREDLDKWLVGDVANSNTGRRRASPASCTPDVAPALERIRAVAKGAS